MFTGKTFLGPPIGLPEAADDDIGGIKDDLLDCFSRSSASSCRYRSLSSSKVISTRDDLELMAAEEAADDTDEGPTPTLLISGVESE